MRSIRIPLASQKYPNLFVTVDESDYDIVSQHQWRLRVWKGKQRTIFYAQTNVYVNGAWTSVAIHRLILRPNPDQQVDHINHDGLDNRRANLRICTPSQNMANIRKRSGHSSSFKGVSFNKRDRRWQAFIGDQGRRRYLGSFGSEDDAARAYDTAAWEAFGEYAILNFAKDDQQGRQR